MSGRLGGILRITYDGIQVLAYGSFTFNPGAHAKEEVMGTLGLNGYTEAPRIARLTGAINVDADTDVLAIQNAKNATIHADWPNGASAILHEAFYAGSGDITSERGEMEFEFRGRGEYVKPAGV